MAYHGFTRLAACCPVLHLADPAANAERTINLLKQAEARGISVAVFPELGLTGYTCHELFFQKALLDGALDALATVVEASAHAFGGLAIVGLPVLVGDRLFNCAAVIARGRLLGLVPKTFLPNYKEFYEARFFASALQAVSNTVTIAGSEVPFGTDLLFTANDGMVVGIEICEDLWVPLPPSTRQALAGANVLVNLTASNETIGKAGYRRQLVLSQSARCMAGYVYAAAGVGESSQDLVFGGHCLVAENGVLLGESTRFQREDVIVAADVDLDRLRMNRAMTTSFHDEVPAVPFRRITYVEAERSPGPKLLREIDAHPFVPRGTEQLRERCEEIFHIQVSGLARRLEHLGRHNVAIGVSGGLDSTLALLVLCKTFDRIGADRSKIKALTMPGFGTTPRTFNNAVALMNSLGITFREIDIRTLCFDEMRALGHQPFGISLEGLTVNTLGDKLRQVPAEKRHDLTFENIQARVRTSLLMNTAFVIGTGDLSELALGWCTYNADHMSMYNPNVSVPKTLVKFLVRWAAENEFGDKERATLLDIVATEISPELLPRDADGKAQSTEATVGPYELHDFFLFHFLRYGAPPSKILMLAEHAIFDKQYTRDEMKSWLTAFLKRFFASQYKRSCLPDGPKVGSVSLSPRGDWRMPSDARVDEWLRELGNG